MARVEYHCERCGMIKVQPFNLKEGIKSLWSFIQFLGFLGFIILGFWIYIYPRI